MLTNEKLGLAIAAAIQKKIESGAIKYKVEVARYFGIKPSSLREWELKGTVSKNKLGALFQYFSDVVDENHWIDESLSASTAAVHELSRRFDGRPAGGTGLSSGIGTSISEECLHTTGQKNSKSLIPFSSDKWRVNVIYSVELIPGQFETGNLIEDLNKSVFVTLQEFSPTAFALVYTGSKMGEMLEHQQPIVLDTRKPYPGDLCMLRKGDGFMYCVFESESPFGPVFRLKGTQNKYTVPQDQSVTVYKVMALRNSSDIQ